MQNLEIREAVKNGGVYLWQLADRLGVSDATLSRKLRKELSAKEKNRCLQIIEQLTEQRLKAGEADAENAND